MIARGLFATLEINAIAGNGLFYGNPNLVGVEALGIAIVAAFSSFGSYGLLKLINLSLPVRVSPEEEEAGLDLSQLGEEAYT